jgi:cytochrome c biogenesis protein CcmG, thiol:disulfide interchange protein DsbE
MRTFFALLLFCSSHLLPAQTFEQPEQPAMPFPFDLPLTTTDSTQTISSQQILATGKPTVLAFWLTTCMPCQMELAAYTERYAAWKKELDFNLYAISTDWPQRFRQIAPKAAAAKWPFPVYWDGQRSFANILPGALNGLPQVFIFDKKGKLVWQHRRYTPGDEQKVYAKLQELAK